MKKAALLLLLAACAPVQETVTSAPARATSAQIEAAKAHVSRRLKDPDSALFRGFAAYSLSNGQTVLCGEVNARNSFGGYVGYETFYLRLRGAAVIWENTNAPRLGCSQAASGSMMVVAG